MLPQNPLKPVTHWASNEIKPWKKRAFSFRSFSLSYFWVYFVFQSSIWSVFRTAEYLEWNFEKKKNNLSCYWFKLLSIFGRKLIVDIWLNPGTASESAHSIDIFNHPSWHYPYFTYPSILLYDFCITLGTRSQPLRHSLKSTGPIIKLVSILIPYLRLSYAIIGQPSSPV